MNSHIRNRSRVTIGTSGNSIAHPARPGRECTAQSIVKAMDDFMAAMSHMRDVVMVPNRLKDLEIPQHSPPSVSSTPNSSLVSNASFPSLSSPAPSLHKSSTVVALANTKSDVDLFAFYQMLHSVHQDLICGSSLEAEDCIASSPALSPTGAPASLGGSSGPNSLVMGSNSGPHSLVMSGPLSLGGSTGSSSSCGDSTDDDSSTDGASTVDSDEFRVDQSRRLAGAFRQHLQGLFTVLHQLTETANHLSQRYQDEVNSGNSD